MQKLKSVMILHWIMAFFILLVFVTGIFVAHGTFHPVSPFCHQSLGILVMFLLISRVILLSDLLISRYRDKLPRVNNSWLRNLALHITLYFFMFLIPLSGVLLRNYKGMQTTFFGITVPNLVSENSAWVKPLDSMHFWLSYVFLLTIALHIGLKWRGLKGRLNWK